jgi:hypothetical protein
MIRLCAYSTHRVELPGQPEWVRVRTYALPTECCHTERGGKVEVVVVVVVLCVRVFVCMYVYS